MLGRILEVVIAYLVLRFIINLFREGSNSAGTNTTSNPNRQQPTMRVEPRQNAPEQRTTSSSKDDDYIDYEEVK